MADDGKQLVTRYLEEAWNNGNVDVLDELFTPELAVRLKPLISPSGPASRTGTV